MKTGNYQRCEQWTPGDSNIKSVNSVIYLYDPRAARARRKKKNSGDLFWNVLFSGLCLSVLVVLFLH